MLLKALIPCLSGLQKLATTETVFIAITTPLSWARTSLAYSPALAAVQPAPGKPSSDASSCLLTESDADLDLQLPSSPDELTVVPAPPIEVIPPEAASPPQRWLSLTAANADRRKPAASARTILEAERTILAAANKLLKTYVICPGILYGRSTSSSFLLQCCDVARAATISDNSSFLLLVHQPLGTPQ